jgi:hypothetical protein
VPIGRPRLSERPWPPPPRGFPERPAWSSDTPARRDLLPECLKPTRQLPARIRNSAGVPGAAGQPPHSRIRVRDPEFFSFPHIPCDIKAQGPTPQPLHAHVSSNPEKVPTRDSRRNGPTPALGGKQPVGRRHDIAGKPYHKRPGWKPL